MNLVQEWLNLRCGWSATALCHHCFAEKETFFQSPSVLEQQPRRSLESFRQQCAAHANQCSFLPGYFKNHILVGNLYVWVSCVFGGSSGFILDLQGFAPTMLRWCSLHSINLGVLIFACGGCFELLLREASLVMFGMCFPNKSRPCQYNRNCVL